VLASGSSGNASLVSCQGFGVLLDVGLGPRQLHSRLAALRFSWHDVHAALLTHTHGDHWNERTLLHLLRRGVPLHCHPRHERILLELSPAVAEMRRAGLVRPYEPHRPFALRAGMRCRPLALSHDGHMTCGFRIEGPADMFGACSTLGYAADLGSWSARLAEALADVDVLALEFNHDVELQRHSGRSPRLIARVLGHQGHLSNEQAAAFVREILKRSQPGRLRHLVQLHLSRDCNRPALAQRAARQILADSGSMRIHTAAQHRPGPALHIGWDARPRPRRFQRVSARPAALCATQPWLPGWDA
jgi:phosphoribosyl 1,2-cyclic phosphodiesterase